MGIKKYKPTSAARRLMTVSDFADITKDTPEKSLTEPLKRSGGRNVHDHHRPTTLSPKSSPIEPESRSFGGRDHTRWNGLRLGSTQAFSTRLGERLSSRS